MLRVRIRRAFFDRVLALAVPSSHVPGPDVAEAVAEKAARITPRLGGVGVMTVALLLQNTVELAERAAEGSAGARRGT